MFRALMRCIERSQADLLEVMEEKQKAAERQAEQFISELEQEIVELKRKNNEMEQLLRTQDHLRFLQVRAVILCSTWQESSHAEAFLFPLLLLRSRFTRFCTDLYTATTGIM